MSKTIKPVNLNHLAVELTKLDEGNINLNISEWKRAMNLAFTHLAEHDLLEVGLTLKHYREKLERKAKKEAENGAE